MRYRPSSQPYRESAEFEEQVCPSNAWLHKGFRRETLRRGPTPFAPVFIFPRLENMELLTLDEIGRLTPPERLSLIAQLWASLEQDQLPVTRERAAEFDHRWRHSMIAARVA